MFRFKRMFLVLLTLFALSTTDAQTPVSLSDALKYALKNSEVLKQARVDIENIKEKVNETRASALPQVSLTSSVTNNLIVQQFVLPAEAFGGPKGEFTAIKAGQTWNGITQIQLSQQIFNQQLFTGLKAAKSSVEFYRLAEQVSRENVMQQVAGTFYQIIITQEKIHVIEANLHRVERLEEMVRGQYENGLAKKIDLDRIRVNKSNIASQKLELENAIGQQKNLLKYYMGMPIEQEIALVHEPVESLHIPAAPILGAQELNTHELVGFRVLEKQKDLLDLQKQAQQAEGLPTLSLGANYMYNTQSEKLNLYTGKALNYDMSGISLNLRVPLFDGNARRSRVKQTQFEIEKVQEEMNKTNNALKMAYDNARRQIANSLEAVETQKANKELAEEVFASTQNNYKNGLATLTDLLNAETELVTAQNSYNEALLNYKVAETDLLKAKGQINQLIK